MSRSLCSLWKIISCLQIVAQRYEFELNECLKTYKGEIFLFLQICKFCSFCVLQKNMGRIWCSIHCTLHSAHYTLYTIHCTLYKSLWCTIIHYKIYTLNTKNLTIYGESVMLDRQHTGMQKGADICIRYIWAIFPRQCKSYEKL